MEPHSVSQLQLLVKSLTLCGSALGGLANTQRVVDFCAKHNIFPRVRIIRHTDLDQVFQQLEHKNDSIDRCVIIGSFTGNYSSIIICNSGMFSI